MPGVRAGVSKAPDQRALRHVIPENRLRLYDMREIIETLADKDSVLEIREKFGSEDAFDTFVRTELLEVFIESKAQFQGRMYEVAAQSLDLLFGD